MNPISIASTTLEEWLKNGNLNSEVNRSIKAYVQENFAKVAFMSSAELAHQVGVSQASITRFALSLGFSGFGEWSKEMQSLIRAELSGPDRLWFAANPTFESSKETSDRVVLSEHLHLQKLNEIVASQAFENLAQAIIAAQRIVFVGARASATLVPYLHYFLSKIKPNVHAAVPGDTLWERLPSEDRDGTLIVALAFPRYPRVLIQLVKDLVDAGYSVAAVTDHPHSPVATHAQPVVFVPVTTASLFDSYATPITLFNLLIRRIAQLTPEQARARLNQLENLDVLHGVYY